MDYVHILQKRNHLFVHVFIVNYVLIYCITINCMNINKWINCCKKRFEKFIKYYLLTRYTKDKSR